MKTTAMNSKHTIIQLPFTTTSILHTPVLLPASHGALLVISCQSKAQVSNAKSSVGGIFHGDFFSHFRKIILFHLSFRERLKAGGEGKGDSTGRFCLRLVVESCSLQGCCAVLLADLVS